MIYYNTAYCRFNIEDIDLNTSVVNNAAFIIKITHIIYNINIIKYVMHKNYYTIVFSIVMFKLCL